MTIKLPTHLNLEFLNTENQCISDEGTLICHVEHDDYGNRKCAIPLKINANGHISLDFKSVISFEIE